MRQKLSLAGKSILLLEPDTQKQCPLIYLHAEDEQEVQDIWERAGDRDFTLACIMGVDWDGELSPWPAPKVFKGGEDFAGKADGYLSELAGTIVPGVESAMNRKPSARGIAGYSLAGLFALHALYKTDLFGMAGSMSGSLWFDGWLDFAKHNKLAEAKPVVYLSLGDRESKTRNARMATVEDCTRQAGETLRLQGANLFFEMNEGNHFADAPERVAKGLRWLVEQAGTTLSPSPPLSHRATPDAAGLAGPSLWEGNV